MSMVTQKHIRVQKAKMEDLIKAYSQAIEYYQSIESDLFADVTVRMQQLLIKPEILSLMTYEENVEEINQKELPPAMNDPENDNYLLSPRLRKF
mmetsp:Transcript_6693/g.5822  ORF Transcript_6693/g.5822 Transcript_6693/m.5822 type:complete len:94 (+) Transcript_6693:59-340(+)